MDEVINSQSLFGMLFKGTYLKLPGPWQRLHDVKRRRVFEGEARVLRGQNIVTKTIATVMGLPPSADVPIRFVVEPLVSAKAGTGPVGECWQRWFGTFEFTTCLFVHRSFFSDLQVNSPVETTSGQSNEVYLEEQFGKFRFAICLMVKDEEVHWAVTDWWLAGVRLPRFLMPVSHTKEFVDEQGRYRFDIDIILPLFGRLIAYKGWLSV